MVNSDNQFNKDVTISNGTVDITSGYIDCRPTDSKDYTFENVTFESTKKAEPNSLWETDLVEYALKYTPTEDNFKSVFVFKNCTFNNSKILFSGLSDIEGCTFEATFENCTFNNLGESDAIEVNEYFAESTITIKNCTFNLKVTDKVSVVKTKSYNCLIVKFEGANTINVREATKDDDENVKISTWGVGLTIIYSGRTQTDVYGFNTVKVEKPADFTVNNSSGKVTIYN